jgi:hypothetical protein
MAYPVGNSGSSIQEYVMGIEILIPLLAIFSIFFIPIAGLTFVFTSKYALKPLVETPAKAMKESNSGSTPELQQQILHLTDAVESLSGEIQTMKEVQEFDRKLLGAVAEKAQGND